MNSETTSESSENKAKRISEAVDVAAALRLDGNEARKTDGFTLLGLVNLVPNLPWSEAQAPLRSIKEIIEFVNFVYDANLAPNTRESIRDALAAFRREGLVRFNPDDETRPVNSPKSVYQIQPHALELARTFGTPEWPRILEKYTARQKKQSDFPAQKAGVRADAFILYNEKQTDVEAIISKLESNGISTYFWRRDIPAGEPWEEYESRQLREARTVLVFLGDSGWGPNHLRIAQEAQSLGKRLIPVLTGNPPEADLDNADGLFRKRRYLDLRQVTPDGIDLIVREVQRDSLPERRSEDVPRSAQIDGIIKALVDGNEEQRSEALSQIQGLPSEQSFLLAQRLCVEIEGRFSPKGESDFASAIRDPKKLSSIRSWMLSSLIWSDAEGPESRRCILNHLQGANEPDRNVRFWALAGLYQRQVSYLSEAVRTCVADSMPEVAALAKAILSPADAGLHEEFRANLNSPEFETTWQVLRILRVIPIPELAGNVCALLDKSNQGTPLAYDALYALTDPVMGREAAKILSTEPGVAQVVARIIREVRESNENAAKNFTVLLAQFEPADVDRSIQEARQSTETSEPAKIIWEFLEVYRRRIAERTGRGNASDSIFQKTYSAFIPDRAAYGRRPGDAPLDDALGVGVHAGHLAQLIAAKETWMPLSIGLFGAWGAGKSHFIDLLDENLRTITRDPGKVFHKQIVQIRFNAWHYLDTNLWANLVCEIFDQLFVKLDERPDTTAAQVEKLKGELAKQSALATEAKEALKTAETARVDAEEKLRTAMKERIAEENKVGALLDDLKNLAINEEVRKQLQVAAEGLGLPKLQSSYAELEARAGEVRSLSGRAKALALAIFTGPGWWKRGLLLGVALAAPLFVAWLADHGTLWIQNLLAGLGRTIAQLVTAIAALSAWISTQAKAGSSLVTKLESAYDEVKKVRAARESKDDAAKAQKALAAKRQAEDEARHTLREAEGKMKAIRAEIAELAPGRQIIRFLKERASAEDYRRHLGLVSLVRRDFEQLSNLLTKAGEEKDATLPQIDRIVLYIDDLDRCRADRVIEVLEAVHLLLAFPLFAVVVAVDPRWLRQSLLDHYPRLLGGADDSGNRLAARTLGRPATPQDYLEKIFQVPFNLQALEKTGYEALVHQLFPIGNTAPKAAVSDHAGAVFLPVKVSAPVETPIVAKPMETVGRPPEPVTSSQGETAQLHESATIQPKLQPLDPQRLALTKKEVVDVQRFQPFFQTPRAVKRLANTYCLIRVGVDEAGWSDYLGHGDAPGIYRLPMLLLAVTSAFPSLSRPWLLWLLEEPRTQWMLTKEEVASLTAKHADTTDTADWNRLAHALNLLNLQGWPQPESEGLANWVPRVARYSF